LWHFEPARVNPIKLAYNPCRLDGPIVVIAFNQLGQYASIIIINFFIKILSNAALYKVM